MRQKSGPRAELYGFLKFLLIREIRILWIHFHKIDIGIWAENAFADDDDAEMEGRVLKRGTAAFLGEKAAV